MSTPTSKDSKFTKLVVAMLQQVYPGAREGRTLDTVLEADVEDTAFAVFCRWFSDWPDAYEELAQISKTQAERKDDRPVMLVLKRDRREPLVVFGFKDFTRWVHEAEFGSE